MTTIALLAALLVCGVFLDAAVGKAANVAGVRAMATRLGVPEAWPEFHN